MQAKATKGTETDKKGKFGGLGDLLGPIGLTLGGKLSKVSKDPMHPNMLDCFRTTAVSNLTSGVVSVRLRQCYACQAPKKPEGPGPDFHRTSEQTDNGTPSSSNQSINEMTTNEWRAAYEQEGCVDLWVEEEFNSGSRLMVSDSS